MERNRYVDFPLPDIMFTEVSVSSRQIGSQELHMIFALECFSLLRSVSSATCTNGGEILIKCCILIQMLHNNNRFHCKET